MCYLQREKLKKNFDLDTEVSPDISWLLFRTSLGMERKSDFIILKIRFRKIKKVF